MIPAPVHEDNVGCINIANKLVIHHRIKHVEFRHHVLRDHIKRGRVAVIHVNTDAMIADVFTKRKFQMFCYLLGMALSLIWGGFKNPELTGLEVHVAMLLHLPGSA